MRLAISTYSFHRFQAGPEAARGQPPVEEMIRQAAAYGCGGIELLGVHLGIGGRQDTAPDRAALLPLKRIALAHAVDLVAVSANHNPVQPDPAARARQVAIVRRCIEAAAVLGAPAVRVFGGRWGTIRDFAAYMAAQGQEPPLPGYTEEDAFGWIVESFQACCASAAAHGIVLALENHWGFTGTAAGVERILAAVGSPWLGVALDTGNFLDDPYPQLERLAPHAVLVHAKAYPGGGLYYTLDLDYRRIGALLRRAGYRGYLSLEYEGRLLPEEGIPQALATLQQAL
jgi:sugar phosphate isomerase/epimerase